MTPTAHDVAAKGATHLQSVLLVEDDPNDFHLAERELYKLKLRNPLRHAKNIEEMIAYMTGEGDYGHRDIFPLPVVILLDMHLFQGDGLDAAAWLRSKVKFRKIPIIAVSGTGTDRLKSAVEMGADALMVKPLIMDEFRKLIARLKVPLEFGV